ncbi:16S rRNA (cytosine(1402)-N(4))-methyltransferase RsmH [Rhodobacterales bacterium HKCCE2091]|nr:16S rRNA (cytosine(1402)-N(4))-methyltransferase RsmH [Rhodobacterales bacterium HKCCE2091]
MTEPDRRPHVPVLLGPILQSVAPVSGVWLDATFGAGGYARGLLDGGAETVIAVDRDPLAFELAAPWAAEYGERLVAAPGTFDRLDELAAAAGHPALDGVVMDLGVSSMQLDMAERGFSFLRDGSLDMRMGQEGPSAEDLVNDAPEGLLADILFHYGEERAARRIARAIVTARTDGRISSTLQLSGIVEKCLPRKKPGESHPATRSFQAIRIAVNDELRQVVNGLAAAERALKPGGWLAVVTFHSLEDRIVKRFLQDRASAGGGGSRHAPEAEAREPSFDLTPRRAIAPDATETEANPRARSAKLRLARRTGAAPGAADPARLGLPDIPEVF